MLHLPSPGRGPTVSLCGRTTLGPAGALGARDSVCRRCPKSRTAHAVLLALADRTLIQTSGGKDSLAAAIVVMDAAQQSGTVDRVMMVHADLGEAEWPGTRELVERHAAFFGVPLTVRARAGGFIGMVEARGMFPDAKRRLCTSSLKRDVLAVVFTEVTVDLGDLGRPALLLTVMGFRAEESPARAKRELLSIDRRASSGKRIVLQWNPVHAYSTAKVWRSIAAAGAEYHPAYDMGMPRLSCTFCILAGFEDLVRAARLRLALAARYVALEAAVRHRIKPDVSMAEVYEEAVRRGPLTDWQIGDVLAQYVSQLAADTYRGRYTLAA
ncbi:phosphoadenosine phosphosulfate reductase family protein [Streptomyces sp. MJM8645]|uniref:phosphoadenosine phosphosulfate reductase domain-containing protein n=1 Tax=Streptomyces sp. MJM8645 TaxID=1120523 RepID=UPI001FCC4A34|nr:phosphoadenosine phosphosulfate reductase family protein [Streptomyces sp. MJM8645]